MKYKNSYAILGAGLLALPQVIQAQPTAHYVPGIEGLKAASLPPPGIYLRDYNVFYYSDRLNDSQGNSIPGTDPKAFIYANVPRVLWITDTKLLGGFVVAGPERRKRKALPFELRAKEIHRRLVRLSNRPAGFDYESRPGRVLQLKSYVKFHTTTGAPRRLDN